MRDAGSLHTGTESLVLPVPLLTRKSLNRRSARTLTHLPMTPRKRKHLVLCHAPRVDHTLGTIDDAAMPSDTWARLFPLLQLRRCGWMLALAFAILSTATSKLVRINLLNSTHS